MQLTERDSTGRGADAPAGTANRHAMKRNRTTAAFEATLLRPADPGSDTTWAFLLLPKQASDTLSRRGRVTVDATVDGVAFRQTLEPDGRLSHWLRVDAAIRAAAAVEVGQVVAVTIAQVVPEPDPVVPEDFARALQHDADARQAWDATTSAARVDWIHWVTSAKQVTTRNRRIADACGKLASGQRRVCCFDASGFYSKALSSPRAAG